MQRYLVQRTAIAIPTLFVLSLATFGLTAVARGDSAAEALRQSGVEPSAAQIDAYRRQLGLDAPWPQRYVRWLAASARGDFGTSILTREPVRALVAERIRPSLVLGLMAFLAATVGGISLGSLFSVTAGSRIDRWGSAVTILLASVPSFWLGLLLILVVAEWSRLLPVAGYGEPRQMILPVVALAMGPLSEIARVTRAGLLDAARADYVRTAVMKGLGRRAALLRHGLPNVLLPVVSVLGFRLGQVLGGAVVVESIFGWPGIGSALITAISGRDLPVIAAFVLLLGSFLIVVNLVTDASFALLDPRIRLGRPARPWR